MCVGSPVLGERSEVGDLECVRVGLVILLEDNPPRALLPILHHLVKMEGSSDSASVLRSKCRFVPLCHGDSAATRSALRERAAPQSRSSVFFRSDSKKMAAEKGAGVFRDGAHSYFSINIVSQNVEGVFGGGLPEH